MATANCVLQQVNLIYAAYGRQTDSVTLEAYQHALADRTDYQVEQAVQVELTTPSDWPIDAAGLRRLSGNYPRTPEERRREAEASRQRAALPSPYSDTPQRFAANREAMRDECRKIMGEDNADMAEWAEDMLAALDACQDSRDLFKAVRSVISGRKRSRKPRVTPEELRSQIATASGDVAREALL